MKTILLILFFAFQLTLQSENFKPELRNEFFEMTKNEQELRARWLSAADSATEELLRNEVLKVDQLNLVRLKEVIRDYGWPGYSLVGPEGSHAFWLLVQHAPDDPFQAHCLELLEKAVDDKEASPVDLAYLTDRVYVHAGRKQIYGTQLDETLSFYPIENEEQVNARRLAIGLPTLEDYLTEIEKVYKIKK